jgi:hypothetical protein
MKMNRIILGLCLAVSMFAMGCGSDTDSTNNETTMGDEASHRDEACMHMTEGPATDVAAAASSDDAANTSAADWLHKRVDLSFDGVSADAPAFVTYEVTEAGEYEIYVSAEASIRIDGMEPEMSMAFDECSTVASIHVFDLEVGEHVIEVVTTNRPLQLVVELMGGDHDDHEGEEHEGEEHEGEESSEGGA